MTRCKQRIEVAQDLVLLGLKKSSLQIFIDASDSVRTRQCV